MKSSLERQYELLLYMRRHYKYVAGNAYTQSPMAAMIERAIKRYNAAPSR